MVRHTFFLLALCGASNASVGQQVTIIDPPPVRVKATLGGYRISVTYAGGNGGSIASGADILAVDGGDQHAVFAEARTYLAARDARMNRDVEKLVKMPMVVEVPVAVPVAVPARDSSCCGVRRSLGNCCGITRPIGSPGCGIATTSYGRCAAWSRVVTRLDCYRDPPHERTFWCNCADHIASCRRRYGYNVVWELVPCHCAAGCSRCGGSGHCGQY